MATKRKRTKRTTTQAPVEDEAPPEAPEAPVEAPTRQVDTRFLWSDYDAAIAGGGDRLEARNALIAACSTTAPRTRYVELAMQQALDGYERRAWKTNAQREQLRRSIEHLAAGGR